ncbi:MAG: hypothetical protein ABJZ55_01985 [Fuerstiella sp.]
MSTQIGLIYQTGFAGLKMRVRRMSDGGLPFSANAIEITGSRPGCYVGGFENVIAESDKQNGYFLAELWTADLSVLLTSAIGKITAEDDELNLFCGVTDPHSEQLFRIEAHAAQITLQGTTIVVNAAVSEGGTLTVYKGSDYRVRNGTALTVTVPDIGGSIAEILKDETKVESMLWGAGIGSGANQVTGTVEADDVVYLDNNTTRISIETTKEQTAAAKPDDCYEWHLKAIAPVVSNETDGDEAVRLEGTLKLRSERARS